MMVCPSEYLAEWAQLWSVRDVIVERTGLRPKLYPADDMICLVDRSDTPTVFLRCQDSCREDLLALLDGLRRLTIRE